MGRNPQARLREVILFSRLSEAVEIDSTAVKGDRMTLPHSYGLALALTILTMLCWGSWANTQKAARGQGFAGAEADNG